MSTSCEHHTWSELAVRENDGLAVSLLWSRGGWGKNKRHSSLVLLTRHGKVQLII
jgi:hypothetical protein